MNSSKSSRLPCMYMFEVSDPSLSLQLFFFSLIPSFFFFVVSYAHYCCTIRIRTHTTLQPTYWTQYEQCALQGPDLALFPLVVSILITHTKQLLCRSYKLQNAFGADSGTKTYILRTSTHIHVYIYIIYSLGNEGYSLLSRSLN